MSLISTIRKDQLAARKQNNRLLANLLTTLIGEAEMVGKNAGNRETTDTEVVAVIKKFVKNANETQQAIRARVDHRDESYVNICAEIEYLQSYLPQQLSEARLKEIATRHTSVADFMKFLKENHAGCYDGKLASNLARTTYA